MTYEEYSNLFLMESNIPCEKNNISGPCCGLSVYRKMVYAPWENGQTLENVTSLTPRLIDSDDRYLGYYIPRIQITSNYAFIEKSSSLSNRNALLRYSTRDFSITEYDPNTTSSPFTQYLFSAVYKNDIVYTMERRWDGASYDEIVIYKITLYPNNVNKKEEIFSWNNEPTVDGIDYVGWDPYFFGRFKYGTEDTIVSIWTYLGEPPQTYLLKVVIYHIDSNRTSEQWVIPSDDMDADIYNLYYASSTPSFYGSKLIFVTTADAPWDLPGPPYGTHCFLPVYMIDIYTDTVTVINAHKFDLDEEWSYVNTYSITSTIDYNTGIFYFTAWVEPEFGPGGSTYLFSMDINFPSVIRGSECSNNLECYQGSSSGYGIDNDNAPGTCSVLKIPSQEIITTVDTLLSLDNTRLESLATIDIDNNMIWNITSSNLQGKSLIGGEDRNITVNWSGGTIPFKYGVNQEAWIRILDGVCIVMVYSQQTSPAYQQTDYYLLKES